MIHFSRILVCEGAIVPVVQSSVTWGVDGACTGTFELVPSAAARRLVPSSHVHLYHAEVGLPAFKRAEVEVTADRRKRGSLFAEECRKSIGDIYWPGYFSGAEDEGSPSSWANLRQAAEATAYHYRFGGEIVSVQHGEMGKNANVTIMVEGYQHLLGRIQAIQLIRGYGTLTEEERKFFGQDQPVFSAKGRSGFYQGLEEVFESSSYGFLEGARRLLSLFPGRLNPMWANRFGWARMADQFCALDKDTSVDRLAKTDVFKKFLRQAMQSQYLMPLGQAMQMLLAIPQYTVVPVPSPAFFPLYTHVRPKPAKTQTTVGRKAGLRIYLQFIDPPGNPVTPVAKRLRRVDMASWDAKTGRVTFKVPAGTSLGPATYTLQSDKLVERSAGKVGAPQSFLYLPPSKQEARAGSQLYEQRRHGGRHGASSTDGVARPWELQGSDFVADPARTGLTWDDAKSPRVWQGVGKETIYEPRQWHTYLVGAAGTPQAGKNVSVVVVTQRTAPVKGGTKVLAKEIKEEVEDASRLHAYAILPRLWWACPPACNVVIPEQVRAITMADPDNAKPTRLLGKIAPGRSGSGKSLLDRFVAPNPNDLVRNAVKDEPRDPSKLTPAEYRFGPSPQTEYFDQLARLVKEEDWDAYLRSYIVSRFWDMRMGARQASVVVRLDTRVVVGAPMLVIRESDYDTAEASPEHVALEKRLLLLERLRRRLQKCQKWNTAPSYVALRRHIAALHNVRVFLEDSGNPNREVDERRGETVSFGGSALDVTALSLLVTGGKASPPERAAYVAANQSKFIQVDGGSPSFVVTPNAVARSTVERAFPGDKTAVELLTTSTPSRYPSLNELKGWFEKVRTDPVADNSCYEAVGRDLKVVDAAIKDTRAKLRSGGGAGIAQHDRSFIGFVVSVSEAVAKNSETVSVSLSHVRYLDEDLDEDGTYGDDPEATVAFGPLGYLDERYSSHRIGKEVYSPIFGCGSVVDAAAALPASARDGGSSAEEVSIADVEARLTHTGACGDKCSRQAAQEGESAAGTSAAGGALRALVKHYRQLKRAGTPDAELLQWAAQLKARATMTLADAYSGIGLDAADEVRNRGGDWGVADLVRQRTAVYETELRTPGFWSQTFYTSLREGDSWGGVELKTTGGERKVATLPLSEAEKDLLKRRHDAAVAYARSTENASFSKED